MRRWQQNQKQALEESQGENKDSSIGTETPPATAGETIAEGIEDDDRVVPDYYDTTSAIPDLNPRLKWVEDDQGNLIDQSEEFLRILPKGYFKSPDSVLSRKMDSNMRQMQEVRKVCAKIGVVKQMQLQSQVSRNPLTSGMSADASSRCTRTNSRNTIHSHLKSRMLAPLSPLMTDQSCLRHGLSALLYSAAWERSSTMPDLRSHNPPRSKQ